MKGLSLRTLGALYATSIIWGSSALAGSISITTYEADQAQGGVDIQAEYDPADFEEVCDPANIRWLQRILLTDENGDQKDDVPGYPSGNFIDPQPDQPGGPFDDDPWYDITYNSAADRDSDTNRQNGAGPFFNDSPSGWGPFGPMSFSATTVLVCIDSANCTFTILEGFTWGFDVAADGTITAQELVEDITIDQDLRDLFNDALDLGPDSFSKWTAVPEPSTVVLLAFAGVVAAARRARRQGASRAA